MKNKKMIIGLLIGVAAAGIFVAVVGKKKGWFKTKEQKQADNNQAVSNALAAGQVLTKGMQLDPNAFTV